MEKSLYERLLGAGCELDSHEREEAHDLGGER